MVYYGSLTALEIFHQEILVILFAVGWINQKKRKFL